MFGVGAVWRFTTGFGAGDGLDFGEDLGVADTETDGVGLGVDFGEGLGVGATFTCEELRKGFNFTVPVVELD